MFFEINPNAVSGSGLKTSWDCPISDRIAALAMRVSLLYGSSIERDTRTVYGHTSQETWIPYSRRSRHLQRRTRCDSLDVITSLLSSRLVQLEERIRGVESKLLAPAHFDLCTRPSAVAASLAAATTLGSVKEDAQTPT